MFTNKYGYTIVQHSGFGYKNNPQFERGLEVRTISTKGELGKVTRAGGIVFTDWSEADNFSEKAMYPEDNGSLIPDARGTFSKDKIDGLAIYIPVREVTG